jgi:hypothetical protein
MKRNSLMFFCLLMLIFIVGCSNVGNPNSLTLEKVQKLSLKGDNLSWQDFEKYNGSEIGSGLYIVEYPINDEYVILIGGGKMEEKPMYIYLVNKKTDEKIDIRYDNISKFIDKTP